MPFHVRLAVDEDLDTLLAMRQEIANWLASRGSDQWQNPWPDERRQRGRILSGIVRRETWLLCDGGRAVATISLLDYDAGNLWTGTEGGREPALYVQRLMVRPGYMGLRIGVRLLGMACVHAVQRDLPWIRLDAWTTNVELHHYYLRQQFHFKGYIPDKVLERPDLAGYPSAALFERGVDTGRAGGGEVARGARYEAKNPSTLPQNGATTRAAEGSVKTPALQR
ncbi:GNAT family N-acetyltransferase [Microbispora sp. ATCC PTA-5024]|uniref:GNAT family N-acetyltransferase n=1 Tax=Microbispora sp. ATCC PTA-5024 TaxID=316330 RepID=UPI0009FBA58B|nr:GNAT family N-acetyltransferase [Microbispora sp. ATCC PTA-5024]